MKIGNIELKHGLLLAPMAGVTDRSFRRICREYGAEYTVTEMVSAKAIHYKDKKTDELAALYDGESPAAVQLFGREPDLMAEAARHIVESAAPAVIDINMGCPVKKVTSNGEGSALMREGELAAEIVRATVKAVDIPVTVKIRAGWDKNSVNAVEFAKRIEDAGAAMVCIHGRTREQLYMPPVDLDIIAAVKQALTIPVVGNGGIDTAEDAPTKLKMTGCDGVMIARGSYGNPWIFAELCAYFEGREYTPPTNEEKLKLAARHLEMLIADKGEVTGVRESRRFVAYYLKGMKGSAEVRGELNYANTADDVKRLIEKLY